MKYFCEFGSFFELLARNFEFTKTPRELFLVAYGDCRLAHATPSHTPSGASSISRATVLLVRRCGCPHVKRKRSAGDCFSSRFVHPKFRPISTTAAPQSRGVGLGRELCESQSEDNHS